jgi:ATP-dependent RNA helicase DDX60
LPLSKLSLGGHTRYQSGLIAKLHESAIPYVARSAFVATSGHGDSFDTIGDLAHNTREGILIEHSAVPSMDDYIVPPILDAYLFDFFKHGQVDALVRDNGVRRGDVWFVLDEFDRILSAIDESLKLVTRGVKIDFAGDALEKHGATKEAEGVWESEDSGDEEIEDELTPEDRNVCQAFSCLRHEFHAKFKKMWA